jgi:hypothetical protein
MAVSKARKAEIKQVLADWLTAGGGDQEVENFRQRFPEVSRSTFFRYLKEARIVAGRKEVVETLKTAQDLREADAVARQVLPVPVTPDMLMPVTNSNVLEVIAEVMTMARRVAETCEREGKIRNMKGFLQAARTLLASVDTAARVTERIYDMQQVERMNEAIMNEIAAESPECHARILKRLIRLRETWA